MLPEAQEQLDQLLGNDVPLGMLTDVISYMLDIDLAQQLSLLTEMDVYRRAELLLAASFGGGRRVGRQSKMPFAFRPSSA